MAYADNHKKFVAVINRRHSLPTALNALGHVTAGLAARLGQEPDYLDYPNLAEGFVAAISRFPFIVLEAKNSSQLAALRRAAAQRDLPHNVFISAMIGGSSAEHQVELTGAARGHDVDYVTIVLFGKTEDLDPLTRKFSLLRDRRNEGRTDEAE
ncbi:MAG TPA: DUF2000 family protein [Aliidongia sp.]|uniref:DUF2000 family protein n=1 Tax=Aliidongia sp. TaxID=1914230 RepID=UPI002DDC9BEE|nr:DUF2000 family protein [Aliidongia sp.]HEV2675655.1 DUF2000 family protein [Aliidongia sp.]